MKRMFADANSFNQSLINWNVSNVTDMSGMFSSANTFNQPINSWDVSNVTDMEEMFDSAFSFTQLLNNWDTSNVTNMRRMFYNISSYNQPLDSWDVSSVTNMEGMFYNNWDFNQPLTNWDVSSVTNMSSMFENAISFNQPLANWNVANVIDMSKMFSDANVFNQSIGNWNTSNVTDMSDMFFRAYEFNQDINNWDTSNVTTMESMFQDTNNFNSPINDWNVSNVENMRDMFNNASAFNQPLNQWNVSNAWNLFRTFYNASNFNQDLSDWDFYQDDGFMYLTDFVSFTNLDVPNYDALLLSFANSGRENQQVGVSGLEYCNVEARNYLINNGWSIFFDNLSPDCSNIFGSVVFDSDNNGCSMTDVLVSNYLINAEGAEGSYSTNVINGDFDLSVYADSFNVSIQNLPSYFSVSPESVLVDFTSTSSEQVDFCLTANQSIEDLNITILPLDEARPGFEANYKLIIKNVGTQSINNISASLVFDGTMQSFVSAVPSETNSSTNSIDFSIASLNPFEVEEIEIIMQTFVPPTVNGEDVLNFTASVLPSASDYTTNDNTYILEQVVVNAYDPNDKQVLQGNSITTDETEEYLDYIIRFQNTGSANATFVRIEDELDADLDWSTIQITSASHNYTVEITNGNEVEFFFDNINLPYETLDEANSHGYIAYKIKPIESIQLGDVMSGDASIYFDYNLPIITNTVSTTVVENLGVDDVTQENLISVYPNPVEDSIHIKSNNRVEVNTVSILNLQGKVLIKEENNTGYISVNQLSSGVYLLSIKTNLGMFNSRIIKN
jgi:surface protein